MAIVSRPGHLSFTAPGEWRCFFTTWLPPDAPDCGPHQLTAAAAGWLSRHAGPPLRTEAQRALADGRVLVETLGMTDDPVFSGISLLRTASQAWDARLDGPGLLVDIGVTGRLDARMLPFWIALGAARGIARARGGLVIDPAWPRAFPSTTLDEPLPGWPTFRLTDHILVMTAEGTPGRGVLMTLGMQRFGLPDLEAWPLPPASLGAFAALAGGACGWLLEHAIATRPGQHGVRRVRMSDEIEVSPALVATSQARLGSGAPGASGAPGEGEGTLARLEARVDPSRGDVLMLMPPWGFHGGRRAWARGVARALGVAWRRPPASGCPQGW